MKKRRRLKKKIRNRLILAFGLLIALFILITLIKGIVGLFHSDNKAMNNEKITEELKEVRHYERQACLKKISKK